MVPHACGVARAVQMRIRRYSHETIPSRRSRANERPATRALNSKALTVLSRWASGHRTMLTRAAALTTYFTTV
jgi:hypothetical protein